MTRLIFNADDFGHSHVGNLRIMQTVSAGLVRSTTVMANMPAARDICQARRERPELGVGVHLNLTEGHPLLPPQSVPSLTTSSGTFWPKRQLLWRSSLGLIRQSEVAAELRAQILQVRAWVGDTTHADFHQNALIFPWIFPAALEVLTSLGMEKIRPQRTYTPAHVRRDDRVVAAPAPGGYGAVAQALWSAVKHWRGQQIEGWGFRGPAFLLAGAPGYKDEQLAIEPMLRWWDCVLPHLPEAVLEVPIHPEVSPAEVAVLTDLRMQRLLEALHVGVMSFAEI